MTTRAPDAETPDSALGRAWRGVNEAVQPFFSRHAHKRWFPPVFWATIFALAALVISSYLRSPNPFGALLAGLLGTLFGIWLGNADPTYGRNYRRLEERANRGDPEACHGMGLLYLHGSPELPRCGEVARKWFLLGAHAGHRPSMLQLADMLSWGHGGPADPDGAREWKARARLEPSNRG